MGFVIKSPVTAEQNQSFVDSQAVNAKIDAFKIDFDNKLNTVNNDLDDLNADLDAVDSKFDKAVANINGDFSVLQADLLDEIERRKLNDDQLNNRITSEVAILNAADDKLKNDLTLAIESEAYLRATEINDTRLALLGVISDNASLQDIQNETFKQQMASDTANFNNTISGLNSKIDNEIANRADNDAAINGNILSLNERLTDSITAVQRAFNSALSQNVQTLSGNINSVSSTLISNVSTLDGKISANTTAISKEVSDRKAAITSETSARQVAVNSLKDKIDSAVNSLQDDISSAVNSLQDFTKTTSGLVPKPPDTNIEQVLTQNGWRDITSTSIYINTAPSQINIPTYDKSNHTAEWLNFDTNKLSISGETSGIDAKTYTAKFKPVGLFVWGADNTQSEKQITWKIDVRKLPKPSISKDEFDYDVNTTHNVLDYANNYIQKYINVSGNTAKDIGDYSVKFALASKTNTTWSDGSTADVIINWKVIQRLLSYEQSNFANNLNAGTFDGSTTFKVADLLSNYNPAFHVLGGTFQSSNAGTFTATISPTANYKWYDATNSPKQITWTVNKMSVNQPKLDSSNSFAHDGNQHSISVTFNSTWISQSGTVKATNPGNYTATYQLKNPNNTYFNGSNATSIDINWNIYRRKLSAALSQNFSQSGSLTFNGNSQSVSVNNFISDYHVLSSTTSAVNAGEYTALITPVADYDWADGYWTNNAHEAKPVNWKIDKLAIDYFQAKTSYDVTGSNITLEISNFDANICNLTGDTVKSAVGDYQATITFKNSNNYCFAGGASSQVINWSIGKKSIAIPTISNANFTFNGDNKTATVNGFDSDTMTSDGTFTASDAGSYSITFSLKDLNTSRWSDNTTAPKTLTWTINRKTLSVEQSTFAATALTYTGNQQNVNIPTLDVNYHTLSSQTKATAAGTYTAKVGVQKNYAFNDGSTAAKSVTWTINKAKVNYNAAELNQTKTFNGDIQELTFTLTSSIANPVTKTGTWQASDAGSYSATVSLSNANIEFNGTSETSLTINWTINRKPLTVAQSSNFRQGETLTYNGGSQTVFINNYDSTVHDLSSTTSAVNAGNYTAQISPKSNYAWNDSTFDAVNVNWKIDRRKVNPPVTTKTNLKYTGEARTLYVDVIGDSRYITQTGDSLTQTEIGNYSRTYSLKNTVNNEWADGSTEPKVISWSIGLTIITPPYFLNDELTYNGELQHPELVGFDSGIMVLLDEKGKVISDLPGVLIGDYYSFDQFVRVVFKNEVSYAWDTAAAKGHYDLSYNQFAFDGNVKHHTLTLRWRIKPIPVPAAFNYDKLSQSNTLDYNGDKQTATFNNFNSAYHQISGDSNINAGEYIATVSPVPGYTWNDGRADEWVDGSCGNQYLFYRINPIQIAMPALNGDDVITFDNQSHTVEISNVNSKFMNISGDNLTQSDPGSYSRTYSLKNTNNTTWATSDPNLQTADVIIPWQIAKTTFVKPRIRKTSIVVGAAPSLLNFNADAMIGSDDYDKLNKASTACGTFTATISLKDPQLSTWKDGSTDPIKLSWEVLPYKLDSTKFLFTADYYDGNYDRPTFDDFVFNGKTFDVTTTYKGAWLLRYEHIILRDSLHSRGAPLEYGTLSGETLASDVGVYTATYTLAEIYAFEDGSTSKDFQWKIKPVKIDKPVKSDSNFTFNGDFQQAPISGLDSSTMLISGITESSDAGSFSVTVAPDKNHCWQDDSTDALTFNWNINFVEIPENESLFDYGTATYTGKTLTPNCKTKGGTLAVSKIGTWYQCDTSYADATYQASAVGDYFIALKPIKNYVWGDNGSTATRIIHWYIYAKPVTAPTLTSANHFDYDGQSHTVTVNNPGNISPKSGSTFSASNIGSYSITYACPANCQWVDAKGNKLGSDNIVISWTIGEEGYTAVAKPYIDGPTSFTFDGKQKNLDVKYIQSAVSVTGNTAATIAGDYSITFKLKSGYVWLDGSSTDIVFNWKIERAAVPVAYSSFAQDSPLTFNGNSQSVTISGFNSTYHILGGTTQASGAGTHRATISPKDNYAWSDGSTSQKSIYWTIAKKIVPAPVASQTVFTYTGETVYFLRDYVSGYDSSIMVVSGTTEDFRTHLTYGKITFGFKEPENYAFYYENRTIRWHTIEWLIDYVFVDKPTINISQLTFNGNNQSPTFDNFDSNTMNISGNVQSDAGTYTATIQLKDTANYRWAGSTSSEKLEFSWEILPYGCPGKNSFVTSPVVVYTGKRIGAKLVNYSVSGNPYVVYDGQLTSHYSHVILTGDTEGVDAGEYTLFIQPVENAYWLKDGSRDKVAVTWKIKKATPTMDLPGDLSGDFPYIEVASGEYTSFTVTASGDGAISAISADTSVATVAVNNMTVRVTGVGVGSTTITVKQEEGKNFNASASKNISVGVYLQPIEMTTDAPALSNAQLTSNNAELQAAILDIQDAILDIYQNGI